MPSAEALDAARDGDRFVVHTARVLEAVETADGLEVTLSDGETLRVAAVVNCAGPCGSPDASTDPLVRSLINLGFARGGPLGIGFDTADDGRLRDIDGRATLPVWTLGSLRRGTLWESTAIPEIRDQAASLAKCLLGPAPVRDRRPRDRYGLALSTTPDAADAWCRALHSICTLQRGAESSLREAVAADPGFAIGHAAHARTHVFYETGDHQGGLRWIDDWIAANADSAEYAAHFSWHAALHELALDDSAAVRRRYVEQLAPPVVAGPRALVDSASLLWRSRLAGAWIDELPIDAVLSTVPSCLLDHPATAFAAMHAVVAFAAAGDVDAIGRLRGFAADYTDPTYRELIVPLCDGFAAQVRGEPALAAERLAVVVPAAARLGGSAAQQEVIAETMVHALVESGQHDAARTFLERRLDRRPRPSDQRRLAALR